MTGGRRDRHGDDVGAVIKRAVKDVQSGYLLEYYPPPQNWNDEFHKLSVSCKRDGVHILTKTGYYAWAQRRGTGAQHAFHVAPSETFDPAEIGLSVRMSRDSQDDSMAHVDLRVDAHDVALVPDGNDYVAQLRLSVIHYLAAGGSQRAPVVPLTLRYNAEQREQALKQGIEFAQDVQLGQEGDRIRFIVFDQSSSNAVGSVTIPINTVTQDPQSSKVGAVCAEALVQFCAEGDR